MTHEHSHHPSGPLALACALAAVAGFVDAHVYVHVAPVFVANMSGNLIHLGVFVGLGQWGRATGSTLAVLAFLAGVIGAIVHHDRELRRAGRVRPDALLAVEAVLVLSLPLLRLLFDRSFHAQVRLADVPVIVVASVAMGMQAAALRRVGAIAVATTYGTGAIVRIGEKVALAVRRADRTGDARRRVTVAVLVIVLVSYVGGAAAAAVLGSSPLYLLIPGIALLLSAVAVRLRGEAGSTGDATTEPGTVSW